MLRIWKNARKAVSILNIAVMLTTAIPVLAEDSDLFVESFDSVVTNALPASVKTEGSENTRVIDYGNRNKALCIDGAYSTNNITFEFEKTSKNFVISFDYIPGKGNMKTSFCLSNGFVPFTIEGTKIFTYDGKEIASIMPERASRVSAGFSSVTNRYFITVDDENILSNWIGKEKAVNITSFSLSTEFAAEDEAYVLIDNVNVYNGTETKKFVNNSRYNNEQFSFERVNYNDYKDIGTIFVNNDFETGLSGLSITAKDNIIERRQENGNGYLYIMRDADTDPLIDVTFSSEVRRYLVLSADFRVNLLGAGGEQIFRMRDADMTWSETFTIGANGEVKLSNGVQVMTMSSKKWYNLAVIYDFGMKKFDFYADGQLLKANVPMTNQKFGTLKSMRITIPAKTGVCDLMIDNMQIYEYPKLYDVNNGTDSSETGDKSVYPPDSEDENKLKDTVALSRYADYMYAYDKKQLLDEKPYIKNDYTMIPVRMVSEAFGLNVSYDNGKISIGDNTELAVGSDVMSVDGNTVKLSLAPEIKNDRAFIPLRDLAEKVLGKTVYYDDETTLTVISDKQFRYTDNAKELLGYLHYDRCSKEQLQEIFNKTSANVHPRVMANRSDVERISSLYDTDSNIRGWIDNAIKDANSVLTMDPAEYKITDGLRLLEVSREVRRRLLKLSFAYQITGDKKYAERAWEEMNYVGQYPDWNPKHFLDVGEMTAAFAVGYDWCYDALTPSQRTYIENCIIKFGLEPGREQYCGGGENTKFAMANMNWNVVCSGGLTMGAVAIADAHPEEAFYIIEQALRGIEYFMPEFAPNGGYSEGTGYWVYATQYLNYMTSTLQASFDTDFRIMEAQGVDHTAEYYLGSFLNTGSNNYHDASVDTSISSNVMYFAKYFNNPTLMGTILSLKKQNSKNGKIAGGAEECLWYIPAGNSDTQMDLDLLTKGDESASMRSSWTDIQGMAVGFHAGSNAVNHAHLDAGTYVLDALGERWAMDLGPDDYNLPGYFSQGAGGAAWKLYRKRAEGHNCFIINPDSGEDQEVNSKSYIIRKESKPKGGYMVADLTDAYRSKVNEAKRGYMLTDDRNSFIVQDEIKLKSSSTVYSFMHTDADITLNGKTAILEKKGKKMQVQLYCSDPKAEFGVMDAKPLSTSPTVDGQNQNSGIKKLYIKSEGIGEITMAMRFTVGDSYESTMPFDITPIDSWTIPDGDPEPRPTLDMIYCNGEPIKNYDPEKKTYDMVLPAGTKDVEITAKSDRNKYEILSKTDGSVVLRVISALNGKGSIYTISYYIIPEQKEIDGYTRYNPVNVEASDVPEPLNKPVNVLDGDFNTRWAAEGEQWIELDLGESKPVDSVVYSYMNGQARSYSIDIQVSEDGQTYTTVFKGTTSGTTDKYEIQKFDCVNARYVRLVGSGNSTNSWNSVTEFGVLKEK